VATGKPPAEYQFTLYSRPDHPEIPSGVKAEPIQVLIQTLGTDRYYESSGSHFGRLQLDSLRQDKRAAEKWSSLPLPTVPPERHFAAGPSGPRFHAVPMRAGSGVAPAGTRDSLTVRPNQ
jgi:hypothetical protein